MSSRTFVKYPVMGSTSHKYGKVQPVTDWRALSIGERLLMITDEFDGYCETDCTVKKIDDDHAVAYEDTDIHPMHLWIDDGTQDMFFYVPVYKK